MSTRETDIVSYLPLSKADPLAIHPTTISVYAFKKRYSDYLAKYPFSSGYIGLKNPFTGHVIKSKAEYALFLREYAYYSFCREFEEKALEVEAKAEDERKEVDSLISFVNAQHKEEKNNLTQELQIETDRRKEAERDAICATNTMKQAQDRLQEIENRRGYAIMTGIVILLLSTIISFVIGKSKGVSIGYADGQSSGYSDGIEQGRSKGSNDGYSIGYDAGYENGNADGYEKGNTDGYKNGYDDGVNDGYETGYLFGKQDGAKTGSSYYSPSYSTGTGSSRDTPIANTYIGNRSSKKLHLPTCSYLPDQSNQVTFDSRSEAIASGYTPCGHCNP